VYSIVSLLVVIYPWHATYFRTVSNVYASIAVASFFSLLSHYLEPTLKGQKTYFRRLTPRNWTNFPIPVVWLQKCTGSPERGPFRIPRSGLTWFNVCDKSTCSTDVVLTSLDLPFRCFPILPVSGHFRHNHPDCSDPWCLLRGVESPGLCARLG